MIRRLALALWLCVLAPSAWAAVALDVAGTGLQFAPIIGSTGVSYTGITVGAGANRALVIGLDFDTAADVSPVITWDNGGTNQGAAKITSLALSVQHRIIYLFGLTAPTSGNKTLKVTWDSTTVGGYVNAIAWTGVDQTGGSTTFASPQTATSGGVSPVAITTSGSASDASVTALAGDSGVHRTATTATSWWADSSGPEGNAYGDYRLGVGSISDTLDGSALAVMIGCTIKVAGGGPACPLTRTRMGVGC